ncbi:MAG TPA: prepilin-type N-terminal cleavage/methylation domain-containing protein [Candidatus Saccharimonadales bacterium]
MRNKQGGFTIVELLIVIVVIAILAAITIVAYNGIQNRANDTAVQSDLQTIVKKIELYKAEFNVYPAGTTQLSTLDLKVSKNAYGNHMPSGGTFYNLVYCHMPAAAPTTYALVAFSKSGARFKYVNGQGPSAYTGSFAGSAGICTDAGVPIGGLGTERDWLYENNNWQPYIGG